MRAARWGETICTLWSIVTVLGTRGNAHMLKCESCFGNLGGVPPNVMKTMQLKAASKVQKEEKKGSVGPEWTGVNHTLKMILDIDSKQRPDDNGTEKGSRARIKEHRYTRVQRITTPDSQSIKAQQHTTVCTLIFKVREETRRGQERGGRCGKRLLSSFPYQPLCGTQWTERVAMARWDTDGLVAAILVPVAKLAEENRLSHGALT